MTVRTFETTTVAFAKKRDRILTNERRSLPERWHDFVMDAEAGCDVIASNRDVWSAISDKRGVCCPKAIASVAALFWIGWEGAVLRAKLDGDPPALRTFANGFFAALR